MKRQKLINWFINLTQEQLDSFSEDGYKIPYIKKGFNLSPGLRVNDPDIFFNRLKQECKVGVNSLRIEGLEYDLEYLYDIYIKFDRN